MPDPLTTSARTPLVTFLEPGVVRLRYVARPAPRSWAVVAAPQAGFAPAVRREGGLEVLETECLRVTLGEDGLRVTDRLGNVLLEDVPGLGFAEEAGGRRSLRRPVAAGERFYGFGEKTGPLDKRGRAMVMRNTAEAPLDTCPTYLREGAIVPRCEPLPWSDARPLARLELDCFAGAAESSFALYEDDGDSLAHTRGEYALVTFRLRRERAAVRLESGPREGTFAPAPRTLAIRLRDVTARPGAVRLDGAPLPERAGEGDGWPAAPGWRHDAAARCLLVACADRPGLSLEVR
jgi:hypothetical protein